MGCNKDATEENEILDELKGIRELLEPKPAPPPKKGLWNEFMDFQNTRSWVSLSLSSWAFISAP